MSGQGHDQHRLLYEFCALVHSILRSPALRGPCSGAPPPAPVDRRCPRVSPAGLVSLLLGMSLALMLCGSVTFVIGFVLMPWVLGLVMVLYFVGIVSSLSVLGRSIFCPRPGVPEVPTEGDGWPSFPQASNYLDGRWHPPPI